MKGRARRNNTATRRVGDETLGLILCLIFFAGGIFGGTFSAAALEESGTAALYNSMSGYIGQIAESVYAPFGFWQVLWDTIRVHLLVIFLGFSLLGVLCLPIVAAVRGFSLSFSITAFIRAFGAGQWSLAAVLFGTRAIITIPVLFVLLVGSFSVSAQLGRALFFRGNAVTAGALYNRNFAKRVALSMAALFFAALLELYITPSLVAWLA